MTMGTVKMLVAALAALTLGFAQEVPSDRVYGRVLVDTGDVYEGYIRWDRNEASWSDILDGTKELPWLNVRDAQRLDPDFDDRPRERSINIFGLRISWTDDDDDYPTSASAGIRFGHLRALDVFGDDRAVLTLKSGQELEFEDGATNLGDGIRGVEVEDPDGWTVELRWDELEVVEFMEAPRSALPPGADRLYGTLTTRSGMEFTGFVAWDLDEVLTSDILDGEERGRERRIPFENIGSIRRAGRSGSSVELRDGGEVYLRDSNDVDEGNRGIRVSDPDLGQVTVAWSDFDAIRFHGAPAAAGSYTAFDGGKPLWGTVETESGEQWTGYIRWDNDEESTWELLDGRSGGVEFDVEFGLIDRIRKLGEWACEVLLLDGRSFELDGSNDVDEDNKGVFVTLEDGDVILVRWWDFAEVTFHP
jgi:hypothetical protein